jgi:hypothetical protein
MKLCAAIMAAGALTGCASYSGIVATGNDTFMVSKQAATGFSGLGNLKTDIIQDASAYCGKQGKALQIINATESQPPFVLGNYPRAEIQFKCMAGQT